MRKLKLQMQIAVDGFVAGPQGQLDWMTFGKDAPLLALITADRYERHHPAFSSRSATDTELPGGVSGRPARDIGRPGRVSSRLAHELCASAQCAAVRYVPATIPIR